MDKIFNPALTRFQLVAGPAALGRPIALEPREPELPRLTQEEIRRIVLDVIG